VSSDHPDAVSPHARGGSGIDPPAAQSPPDRAAVYLFIDRAQRSVAATTSIGKSEFLSAKDA